MNRSWMMFYHERFSSYKCFAGTFARTSTSAHSFSSKKNKNSRFYEHGRLYDFSFHRIRSLRHIYFVILCHPLHPPVRPALLNRSHHSYYASHAQSHRTRRKTMSHIVLTVLTIVMFGIVTSHIVLSLTIGPTPPRRFCPSISCVLAQYLPCLNFVLGDLIVIWRAWVIWGRNKHVFVLPLFLIIATVADVSTVLVLSIRAVLTGADLAADSGAGLALIIMHTLCIALTFCTNALVTLFVGYRTWYFTSDCGGSRWHIGPDRCLPVLLLLIESGALYCIVWVTYIVLDVLYGDWAPSRSLVFHIFQNTVPQITGIYPTLIIILCSLKRTFHDIVSPRPSPGSSYNNLDLENSNSSSSKARRLPNQEAGFNDTSLTLSTPVAPQHPSSIPLRPMRPYHGGTMRSPPLTFEFTRRPSESSPAASEYVLTGVEIETASIFALAMQDAIKATNGNEGTSWT